MLGSRRVQAAARGPSSRFEGVNATDADLSRFAARGGRLILYHGRDDAAIQPLTTVD